MRNRISKVAVLGSGVMGSGIACHLANIGLEVLLLDIVPFDLKEEEKQLSSARNRIVNGALKKAIAHKLSPLYKKSFAKRISTGNFDDDMHRIADCDWIIEVIVERLDIKQLIFEKVEKHRTTGTLITSNTSGIPISDLAEGRSDDFQKHFCGTHFFNPPRYLRLMEVIPHSGTDPEVIDFFMNFGERYLGKQTVLCKDTPAFIGNRIGFYSGSKLFELTEKHDLSIEEVDKLTGSAIARPNTGTYRLQDLVGIDTAVNVTKGVLKNCPNDEYVKAIGDKAVPTYMQFLLDNKFLGNKTGQGFYKKTNERDDAGKRIILALNLKTLEYQPSQKPRLPSLGIAKKVELIGKRLEEMFASDDKGGRFLKEYFAGLFAYSSNRIPEICDHLYSIDHAMISGYAWDYGPFEYWDLIGIKEGAALAEEQGEILADWVKEMISSGHNTFYKRENGKVLYYDISTKSYLEVPGTSAYTILDNQRKQTTVFKNSEASIHDIGDQVLCVEFHSKANAIGTGTGEAMLKAIEMAEEGDWRGIVIGNNAKNFTVGANLMAVGMIAMQKDFETLEEMVNGFQQIVMKQRYSKIPVVLASQGYVFGGGCEIQMHCDATIAAAESYIGLVEVGVGLIPGGGGTKEMALRASDLYFEGDVMMPTLIDHFKPIATAGVATSAYEAFDLHLLNKKKDFVEINKFRNISEAKKKVIELSENYVAPIVRNDISVLGRAGLATLYTAINEFYLGNYMSKYDVEIARKVAWVMCGGDLTGTQKVGEQYLLDLEREAFLSLLGNQKTLDRIQHTLMTNKPLRN